MLFEKGISRSQQWWWTLLGREISCPQWEGPRMHSRCLTFFPLEFWGKRGGGVVGWGDFLLFSPISQCVFIMFQWVPMSFPMYSPSSQCVSEHGLHMLWQMLACFHLYSYYPCSYKFKTCIIVREIKEVGIPVYSKLTLDGLMTFYLHLFKFSSHLLSNYQWEEQIIFKRVF